MSHCFTSDLRRWDVCVGLLPNKGLASFCEVGCKSGRTTGAVLKALPNVRVTAIDPWAPLPNAAEDYSDHDFKKIEREFWENVGPHKDRVSMLKMTSIEAAERCHRVKCNWKEHFLLGAECDCDPQKFDTVFIDAGHDLDSCLADIRAWWPLVKDGAFLCGHDFQHRYPGVMQAVAKCFPLMNVGVCPDSVWVVQKTAQLRMAA